MFLRKRKGENRKINFLDELDNKFGNIEDESIFSAEQREVADNNQDESGFTDNQTELASHVVQEDEFLFGGDLLTGSSEEKTSVQSKENTFNQRSKTQRIKSDLPDLSYSLHPRDNRNKYGDKPTRNNFV